MGGWRFARTCLAAGGLTLASCGTPPGADGPTVSVVDETGAPVAHAFVGIWPSPPPGAPEPFASIPSAWPETDATGRAAITAPFLRPPFALSVVPDPRMLLLTAAVLEHTNWPGSPAPMPSPFAPDRWTGAFDPVRVRSWSPGDPPIRVVRNPSILLRAVDRTDGDKPMPGATFRRWRSEGLESGNLLGTTDERGEWHGWIRRGEKLFVTAAGPSGGGGGARPNFQEVSAARAEWVFAVGTEPHSIRLSIVDDADPRLDLAFRRRARGVPYIDDGWSMAMRRRTGPDVEVDGLLPGLEYDLWIEEEGSERFGFLGGVRPSAERHPVRLVETASIRGRVVGPARFASASVFAEEVRDPTRPPRRIAGRVDAEGRFEIERVRPGRYRVEVTASVAGIPASRSAAVVVSGEDATVEVDFR